MKKLLISFILIVSCCFSGCAEDSEFVIRYAVIEPIPEQQITLGETVQIIGRVKHIDHNDLNVVIYARDTDIAQIIIDDIRDATDANIRVNATRDAAFNVTGALSTQPTTITEVVFTIKAIRVGETTVEFRVENPDTFPSIRFRVQVKP